MAADHGTDARWQKHHSDGEEPCDPTDPCPLRHLHAPYITRAMKLRGLTLTTCPCGLKAAVKPKPRSN